MTWAFPIGAVRRLRAIGIAAIVGAAIVLLLGFSVRAHGAPVTPQAVEEFELEAYAADQDISTSEARKHLVTQHRGIGIVEHLEDAQGESYAGVWFDSKTGHFVIPVVDEREMGRLRQLLAAKGLASEYRLDPVRFSWGDLIAAQHEIDQELQPQIKANLIQTAIDPRLNAVIIDQAEALRAVGEAEVERMAATSPVRVKTRKSNVEFFRAQADACNIYWYESAEELPHRNCDRPLRGGVAIFALGEGGTPQSMCSMGFAATGLLLGNPFMLTAGHCVSGWTDFAAEDAERLQRYIGVVEAGAHPVRDYAAVRVKQTTPAGEPNYWLGGSDGWQSRVVYWGGSQNIPIEYEAASYMGQQLCRSGTRTGSSCGQVTEMNRTVHYEGDPGPIYGLTVANYHADNGDSGGSVWAGNTALGLHSGSAGPTTRFFQEVTEAADAMAVRVGARVPAPPFAVTGDPGSVSGRQATLTGSVDPAATATTYRFEYGPTTAYGSSTAPVSAGAGHNPVGVSQIIAGLTPTTTYHYRIVAENAAGASFGSDKTLTTDTAAPLAETRPVIGRGLTTATLAGGVEPGGLETSYYFEYGLPGSYNSFTFPGTRPASTGYSAVEGVASNLKPETLYSYRLKASNSKGDNFGVGKTFTTLARNFAFSGSFGSAGSSTGQFSRPLGVDTDPAGNVWVVDRFNHRVSKFSPSGEHLLSFGSKGSGPGQFNEPRCVAIAPDGHVWVTDFLNARVQEFSATGQFIREVGPSEQIQSQLTEPYGIAVDGDGFVYVSDLVKNSVVKYRPTPDGSGRHFIASYGSGVFESPGEIDADAEGDIWVPDILKHAVYEVGDAGVVRRFGTFGGGAGEFSEPYAIEIKPSGNLLVVDRGNHRIQQFSPQGELLTTFGSQGSAASQFLEPSGLALTDRGVVYVSDSGNHRVHRWTQQTAPFVLTDPPSAVGPSAATLNGFVTPNGLPTSYRFEYGLTKAYGSSVPVPNASVGSGSTRVPVSQAVSGLEPGMTYHYRVRATNSEGTTFSADRRFVTPATASYLSSFGSAGSSTGQFSRPLGVDTDPAGNVWVVDRFNHRVSKFSPSGEHLLSFGSKGSGPGQFNEPRCVAIAPDGHVWVTDFLNARVQEFSATGQFIRQVGSNEIVAGKLTEPYGIAVDGDGFVYVSDLVKNSVVKYRPTPDGSGRHFIASYGSGVFESPGEIDADAEGDIWVPDILKHAVYEIDPDQGQPVIFRFGSAGNAPGQISEPYAVEMRGSETLFVVDRGNNRIQQFTDEGALLLKFGSIGTAAGQFTEPSGLALGLERTIFVSDSGNKRIQRWKLE